VHGARKNNVKKLEENKEKLSKTTASTSDFQNTQIYITKIQCEWRYRERGGPGHQQRRQREETPRE
jgi:hypothetical protein